MNIALALVAALGAMLLFLLATASANTTLFAENYPLLLGFNAVAALLLIGLVFFRLSALWRDYRGRVFGSRLKWRLVVMLSLMAVIPGALVYAVSMQFAVKSIDSWFDVRVEKALEDGLNLGRNMLDSQRVELLARARNMALDLGAGNEATRINRLREQAGIDSATLYNAAGNVLASSSASLAQLLPPAPAAAQLRQTREGRGMALVENTGAGSEDGGLTVRALVPVYGRALGDETRVLQLTQSVPSVLAQSAQSVAAANRDYQELQLGRTGIKGIYTLTLTFTLLLALFAAVALAFFLAERLARPLLMLAEGTQAVAKGDFTPRQALATHDELGVLTQSFQRMTEQLQDARQETESHRQQLEAASAYLESVLTNLSAGVLAFDAAGHLRAANRGATAILGDDLADLGGIPLNRWPRHEALARAIHAAIEERGDEWQEQLQIESAAGMAQTLLLRGRALPQEGGHVVVFDDISYLISAQRAAAWGEVAQRLAHEIKNPLMPIQLAAERMQKKLGEQLDPAAREILDRSTRTIVTQVEAMKNMANDFRDYAKTPPPQRLPTDLNALLREVLSLYEAAGLACNLDLDAALPPVLADANQLRQVLHNLLKNAREAQPDTAAAVIDISTKKLDGRRAQLSVADRGPGFDPRILARAFEPYVTSKSRGTGLGLSIVKKIIDEHHGEITLANRPEKSGGGALVTLKLPFAGE